MRQYWISLSFIHLSFFICKAEDVRCDTKKGNFLGVGIGILSHTYLSLYQASVYLCATNKEENRITRAQFLPLPAIHGNHLKWPGIGNLLSPTSLSKEHTPTCAQLLRRRIQSLKRALSIELLGQEFNEMLMSARYEDFAANFVKIS